MYKFIRWVLLFFAILFKTAAVEAQGNKVQLEALLIVGHQEDLTADAMENMDDIAEVLEAENIKVHRFYDEKADWEEIKKLSGKCSFLIYSGHGTTAGENSVGGICINSIIAADEYERDLKLKPNAIVCFQSVCLGAGSTAGDDDDIGIKLARERVSSYARPFLNMGAGAYYANNYHNGVKDFLNSVFDSLRFEAAYDNSLNGWAHTELDEELDKNSDAKIMLATSPGGGMATRISWKNGKKTVTKIKSPKGYEIAFVGNADLTILDVYGKP